MAREIYCADCKRFVGEIRDARLMKGLAFVCSPCEAIRSAAKTKPGSVDELLNGFFGRRR